MPSVAKGQKANMVLKGVAKTIFDITVKVPVLVSNTSLNQSSELCWDKGSAKALLNGRSYIDCSDVQMSFKRRKLV